MKPFLARITAAALLTLASLPALPAMTEAPQISSFRTVALKPGITNLVVLDGAHLQAIHSLWTTWSGQRQLPPRPAGTAGDSHFELTLSLPRDFPSGIEMIRLIGSNGVSNPLLVLVDDLPAVASGDTNLSVAAAQRLPNPSAIDGTCTAGKSHYFRLQARRGQILSVEVVAHRLGHPTDPVLRLLDSNGGELLYVNDTPGMGSDCAFEFLPDRSEELLLELRDTEYSGGEKHRYRVRIGRFPTAVAPFPTGIDPSRKGGIRWDSTVSKRTGSAAIVLSGHETPSVGRLRLSGRDNRHAITPRLPIEASPGWTESEPNNTSESANRPVVERAAYGRFDRPGDLDWYQFVVDAPGPWRFEVRSRRLGLPCDPLIRLLDSSGATLATGSTESLDSWIGFEFKEAGTYRLALAEAAGRSGPGRSYQLRLVPRAAQFGISSETDVLQLPVGTNTVLKLKVEPEGYDGPIRLDAGAFPEGITLENPVIERKKKEWDLKIQCAASVSAGMWGQVKISALPKEQDDSLPTPLQLDAAMRKHFPELLAIPPGFAGDMWFCTVPNEPPAKDSSAEKSPR